MRQYLEDALVMLYRVADSGKREVDDWELYVMETEYVHTADTHLSKFMRKVFPNREPSFLTSKGGWHSRAYVVNQEKLSRAIAAVEAAVAREATAELTDLYENSVWKNQERTTIDNNAVAQLICGDWVDQGDGTSALEVTATQRSVARSILEKGARS